MYALSYPVLIKSQRLGEIDEIICPDLNLKLYPKSSDDRNLIQGLGERTFCARRLERILREKDHLLLGIPRPSSEDRWKTLLIDPHDRFLMVECPYAPKQFFFEKYLKWIAAAIQSLDTVIDLFFAFISLSAFSEGGLAIPIIGLVLAIFYDFVYFGASGVNVLTEGIGRSIDDLLFRRESEFAALHTGFTDKISALARTGYRSAGHALFKLYHQPKACLPKLALVTINIFAQGFMTLTSYQSNIALADQAHEKLGDKWWLDKDLIKSLSIINIAFMLFTEIIYMNLFSNMALPNFTRCCRRRQPAPQAALVFSPRESEERKEEPRVPIRLIGYQPLQ